MSDFMDSEAEESGDDVEMNDDEEEDEEELEERLRREQRIADDQDEVNDLINDLIEPDNIEDLINDDPEETEDDLTEVEDEGEEEGEVTEAETEEQGGETEVVDKPHRKRKHDSDEEEDDIDEEDLELIQENTGLKLKKNKHSRVKLLDSDDDDEDGDDALPVRNERDTIAQDLFDADDDDNESRATSRASSRPSSRASDRYTAVQIDANDDGAEEEEDIDDFIVGDDDQPINQVKKKKKRHLTVADGALQEAQDIFGLEFDLSEFDGADGESEMDEDEDEELDEDDEEAVMRRERRLSRKKAGKKSIYEVYEPSELEKSHLTTRDNEIKLADVPERFQLRPVPVVTAADAEIEEEAIWIYRSAFVQPPITQQLPSDGRQPTLDGRNPMFLPKSPSAIPKIKAALSLMKKDLFEVPYIATYKKEEVEPDLKLGDLWQIYEWDEKWTTFSTRKSNMKTLFEEMQTFQYEQIRARPDDPLPEGFRQLEQEDIDRLEGAQSPDDLMDIYAHFQLHYSNEIPALQKWKQEKSRVVPAPREKRTKKKVIRVKKPKQKKEKKKLTFAEPSSDAAESSVADASVPGESPLTEASPAATEESSAFADESPAVAGEAPADEDESPSVAGESPAAAEESPAVDGESPADVDEFSEAIGDAPKTPASEEEPTNETTEPVSAVDPETGEAITVSLSPPREQLDTDESALDINQSELVALDQSEEPHVTPSSPSTPTETPPSDSHPAPDDTLPASQSDTPYDALSTSQSDAPIPPEVQSEANDNAIDESDASEDEESEYEDIEVDATDSEGETVDDNISQAEAVRRKLPRKRDLYTVCKDNGLLKMMRRFGLSAEQFGENMRDNYQKHEPEQYHLEPNDAAEELICNTFPTATAVLEGARHMVAFEISREPLVKQTVRQIFYERAKIYCSPTQKGKKEIDEQHQYSPFKFVKSKPVQSLFTDQFLRMCNAEDEKLVKITIDIDQDVAAGFAFVDEVKKLYERDEFSQVVQLWNAERAQAVEFAMKKILFPALAKELKRKLLEEAKYAVIQACAQKLGSWINIAPYQADAALADDSAQDLDSIRDSAHGCRVLACSFLPDRKRAAFMVMLDADGQVIDFLRLTNLTVKFGLKRERNAESVNWHREKECKLKEEDLARMKTFVLKHQPHVLAVCAECLEAENVARDIADALQELEAEQQMTHIYVELVDGEVARLFQNSPRSKSEFPEYPELLRHAISIGRRLQEPLVEFAGLCDSEDELLCLRFHPLQELVNQDRLIRTLDVEFINVVNRVGVDMNRALEFSHTAPMVQYVCGLGPRKGGNLIKVLKQQGSRLENRSQLVTVCEMGLQVFLNCAGFIRISPSEAATSDIHDVLDGTRIHPETYEWARKMAVDALEDDEGMEEPNPLAAVEEILEQPDRLRDLDLDVFAEELKRQKYGDKHITLYDIRDELINRFKDQRLAYPGLSSDERFRLLSGETHETLYIGKMIACTVSNFAYKKTTREELDLANPVRDDDTNLWQCPFCLKATFTDLSEVWIHFDNNSCPGQAIGARVRLVDTGLDGMIFTRNISDKEVKRPEERVKIGMTLYCRVLKIDVERVKVDLTCKSSDLADHEGKFGRVKDLYYDLEVANKAKQVEEAASQQRAKRTTYIKRVISHPSFRNVTFKDSEKLLASMEQGECIVRPSSKGPAHLTVTWKVAGGGDGKNGIYQHIDVREEGKSNDFSIGTSLWIDNEEYEDLDEIQARYISPCATNVREILQHPHYVETDGQKDKLQDLLVTEKRKAPGKIPYYFSTSRQFAGKFMLGYLPRHKPRLEFVTVTPDGFRYRGRVHENIGALVKWFKEHFRDPIPGVPSASARRTASSTGTSSSGSTLNPRSGMSGGGSGGPGSSMGSSSVGGGSAGGSSMGSASSSGTAIGTPYTPGASPTNLISDDEAAKLMQHAFPRGINAQQLSAMASMTPATPGGRSTPGYSTPGSVSSPGTITPGFSTPGSATPSLEGMPPHEEFAWDHHRNFQPPAAGRRGSGQFSQQQPGGHGGIQQQAYAYSQRGGFQSPHNRGAGQPLAGSDQAYSPGGAPFSPFSDAASLAGDAYSPSMSSADANSPATAYSPSDSPASSVAVPQFSPHGSGTPGYSPQRNNQHGYSPARGGGYGSVRGGSGGGAGGGRAGGSGAGTPGYSPRGSSHGSSHGSGTPGYSPHSVSDGHSPVGSTGSRDERGRKSRGGARQQQRR